MRIRSKINRRAFLARGAALAGGVALSAAVLPACSSLTPAGERKRIPVILGTDIGDDIDDTWALGFLLRCPELDLKLAYGEYGKSQYRARLIAKFLQTVGRADVPVAVGPDTGPTGEGPQAELVREYDLMRYPGRVRADAVEAIVDVINASPEPVTVISIAPAPVLAAALRRDPGIARRARLVGMYGSLRSGYKWRAGFGRMECEGGRGGGPHRVRRAVGKDHHTAGHVRAGETGRGTLSKVARLDGSRGGNGDRELSRVGQGNQKPGGRSDSFEHFI